MCVRWDTRTPKRGRSKRGGLPSPKPESAGSVGFTLKMSDGPPSMPPRASSSRGNTQSLPALH